MSPRSASESDGFQGRYVTALERYLVRTPGTTLRAADALGREAANAGIRMSTLATMHRQALMTLVPFGATTRTINGRIARASTFFVAGLKALNKTRGSKVADDGDLTRLQDGMRRSKRELARAQRSLQRESARRKRIEVSLRESKREHARMLKKALAAQQQLRRLSHQVLSAQEEERKRISRELHDEIGQTLTAIHVNLERLTVQANIDARVFKRTVRNTQRLVLRSMNTVHTFARNLRPPVLDDVGLIPALKALFDVFTKKSGVPVRFKAFSGVEGLDADKRTVLYRVAQEAVTNVAAHAQASLMIVELRREGRDVRMDIRDNGKGFDVKRRLGAKRNTRLGLVGMRERLEMVGGSFDVTSTRADGTTIRATIPFDGRKTSPRARRRVLSP